MALDNFDSDQKRDYVIVATAIGLILSITSTAARFLTKFYLRNGIQAEDWFIAAGLLLSFGIAGGEFYGTAPHRSLITLWFMFLLTAYRFNYGSGTTRR